MPKLDMEPSKILRLGAINCHGMKEKIDYPEFYNLVSNEDIFGVSETWLIFFYLR